MLTPAFPEVADHHIDSGFCERSVELELKEPHDLKTLQDLVEICHVVLLGYRSDALDKPVQALDQVIGMGMVAAVEMLLANDHLTDSQTALARTAYELTRLRQPIAFEPIASSMANPTREFYSSVYGRIEYVPPPLLLEDQSLEYSTRQVRYGSSTPQ